MNLKIKPVKRISRTGRKQSSSFLAGITGLLLLAGFLIGGLLRGNMPVASDVP